MAFRGIKILPGKFAALRESLGGKTQEEVAVMTDLGTATIGRLESPNGTSIDKRTFRQLATKLGFSESELHALIGEGPFHVGPTIDPRTEQRLRVAASLVILVEGCPDDRSAILDKLESQHVRKLAEIFNERVHRDQQRGLRQRDQARELLKKMESGKSSGAGGASTRAGGAGQGDGLAVSAVERVKKGKRKAG